MSIVEPLHAVEMATRPLAGPMPTVLLVDPVRDEQATLSNYLREHQLSVIGVDDVEAAWDEIGSADAVVVVASLPDQAVSAFIRRSAEGSGVPILVMSETAEYVERVLALELGAHDLVERGVNHRELLARVRGMIHRRRVAERGRSWASPYGETGWRLEALGRVLISPQGHRVEISRADFLLLAAFADRTERQIFETESAEANLRTAVSRLRQKVLRQAGVELPLRNVRGLGYRFDAGISKG